MGKGFLNGIDLSGLLRFRNSNGFIGTLQWNPTADRALTFPDKDGTVATLSDVTGVTVPPRNTSILNQVIYTPLNNSNYSYYDRAYDMQGLQSNNAPVGMMALDTNVVYIKVGTNGRCYLNSVQVNNGQFNGAINCPSLIRIFEGFVDDLLGTPLYQSNLDTDTVDLQSFSLASTSAFDTPRQRYTVVFSSSGSNVSVRKLRLLGQYIDL